MPQVIPERMLRVNCDIEEYVRLKDLERRKLYLSYGISMLDEEDGCNEYLSSVGHIVKAILDFNEQDKGLEVEERIPIRLFINSPGGSITEGFPLVSTIELSKTPVYTINIGTWASMAFCIGIAGHKRFALPRTVFAAGPLGSAQDAFSKRYEKEVIKKHILAHSKMSGDEYDDLSRCKNQMLPEDAQRYGFIDEIITDIDTILMD